MTRSPPTPARIDSPSVTTNPSLTVAAAIAAVPFLVMVALSEPAGGVAAALALGIVVGRRTDRQ